MHKKAVSLSLETLIVSIIILIVLFFVAYFVIKYGGDLGSVFKQQTNASASLLHNITP